MGSEKPQDSRCARAAEAAAAGVLGQLAGGGPKSLAVPIVNMPAQNICGFSKRPFRASLHCAALTKLSSRVHETNRRIFRLGFNVL